MSAAHVKSNLLPPFFELLYSKGEIQARLQQLSSEISEWANEASQESGLDLLTVPIMRGGIFLFADIVRMMDISVAVAPIRAWAYRSDEQGRDTVHVATETLEPQGRTILLIDDICDSGRTLTAVKDRLFEAGAAQVRSVVLIHRRVADKSVEPDWSAFIYEGAEWFVGYGMDTNDHWRNLPQVYRILKEQAA